MGINTIYQEKVKLKKTRSGKNGQKCEKAN